MIAEVKKYDAIYARQSVEKEDSLSIQTQFDIAKPLCSNEIRYYSDPGWSGSTMKRPELQRLFRDVERGVINKIVVYRLDRLSRMSMYEFFGLIDFFQRYHVGFTSATEPFDTTTPMGEYMMSSLAIIARLERQNISARILDNVEARVKRGYWVSGPAPYGFNNIKEQEAFGHSISSVKANGDMQINIYIMNTYYYEENSSLGTIRDTLNQNNILTARGKRWSAMMVSRRIQNTAPVRADLTLYQYFKEKGYIITSQPELWTGEHGCLLVKKQGGDIRASVAVWEGYIDSKVWIGCQEKAKRKKHDRRRGTGKISWLLGLCKCGFCGYSLTGSQYKSKKTGVVHKYAYCSQKREGNCSKGKACHYDYNMLENLVEEQLIKIIEENKRNESIAAIIGTESFAIDPQKQLRLIKLEEELGNFLHIIGTGDMSKTTLKILNQEIEKRAMEKAEIEAEINRECQMKIPMLDFSKLSFEDKRMVARAYIRKISLFGNDHMQIEWNL